MKTIRPALRFKLVLSLLLVSSPLAFAQTRPFISFDAPDAGHGANQGTTAGFINASGVIAGGYLDSSSRVHGYVRSVDGQITEFDPPGLINTFVYAMNSKGQIVGSASLVIKGFGHSHGFLRLASGSFVGIDPPGAEDTAAESINDGGAIAGTYNGADGVSHAFLRDPNGAYTSFDVVGAGTDPGMGTTAVAINSIGQITGRYVDPNNITHGYIRDAAGNIVTFDAPGVGTKTYAGTLPTAINLSGQVTGYYWDDHSRGHSFIRDTDGNITNADVPGAFETFVFGMNNQGSIVGEIVTANMLYAGLLRDFSGRVVMVLAPGTTSGTLVFGVNDSGRISGTWFDGSLTHGFVQ